MNIFIQLLRALILTVIIEGTAVMIITKSRKVLLHSVYCNLMTNPLLNLIGLLISFYSRGAFIAWIVIGEAAVVLSEAALYRLFGDMEKKRSYIISFIANLCSFKAGLIINRIGI